MNEDSGVQYMSAWQVGQGLDGLGGVGQILASSDASLAQGDLVAASFLWPWKAYFIIDSKLVKKVG